MLLSLSSIIKKLFSDGTGNITAAAHGTND